MTEHPLPTGWARTLLDQVAEVRLGRQRSPKNHTGTQMRPYLRAANLTWGGIDVSDVKEMNFTDAEVSTYQLVAGDILLSEASGSAKEVGKPGVWRGQMAGDICFQNTLIRVRPEQGVDSEFMYYRFLHEALCGGFVETSRGVGIHHLGSSKLASLPLELPPTAEQRRIAARLNETVSQLDGALCGVHRLALRLRQLTDSVLSDVIRRAALAVENLTPVGDVCVISGGIQKQPKRYPTAEEMGVPFLRVANVGRRSLDLDDVHRILVSPTERERVLLQKGDLLVVEGNGSPDQIGRAALWRAEIDPCTHQNHLIRVRPSQDVLPEYLELAWNAPTTAEMIKGVASTTSGLYTLSSKKVAAIKIPVPSLSVQRALVKRAHAELEVVAGTKGGVETLLRMLQAMRRSVLNAAFTGELVSAEPDDDVAEDILRRIHERRTAAATAVAARKRTVSAARASQAPKSEENPK